MGEIDAMNLPDKCPFCGAGTRAVKDGNQRWVEFDCFSTIGDVGGEFQYRSPICRHAELNAAKARVTELEARCKRLEEAGDKMLSVWLMPEDSMSYSDWVCLSSDAKSGWYASKEAKP